MSTSPSWFDQEKLSRLVKKVGPKTITEVLPTVLGSEKEDRPPAPHEGLASTARISLVSKPQSLLSENRALPALPRRTGALPSIKAMFPNSNPAVAPTPISPAEKPEGAVPETPETENAPAPEAHAEEFQRAEPEVHDEEHAITEIWHKMGMLNEELAKTVLERDQAQHENRQMREQLARLEEEQKEEALKNEGEKPAEATASADEIARLTKERDDAIAEGQGLRAQLLLAKEAPKESTEKVALGDTQEITIVTGERDQARRQYAELRSRFESLKQEQAPKEETIKFRKEWEQQLEELNAKLEEKDKEIAALKAAAEKVGGGDEKLKTELTSLRDQLTRAKDEASVAQRGLALSQKALQQTRDTLREATEGTSLSRHNFDNLKNECAILAQQNTVLQAQVDQMSRDLNASKGKLTTRLLK
jgi:regulator of replication initiation timing